MLTIILPFYKKFQEFKFAFELKNLETFNQLTDLELMIVADSPQEIDLLISYLSLLISQKKINFSIKIILNENDHPWRCPSVAINVGINHATYEKLLVLSPETLPLSESISTLEKNTNNTSFALGLIGFASQNLITELGLEQVWNNLKNPILPYGSICFTKNQATIIGGYDESFIEWGGDDDDFRFRLTQAGFNKCQTLARFLHIKIEDRGLNKAPSAKQQKTHQAVYKKITLIKNKKLHLANQGVFGQEFNKIAFSHIAK